MRRVTGEVLARRAASQLLTGPPATAVEGVVERLLAVQAQDPRGARLAVRSRSTGLSAAAVDAALTTERSLVVTTLNRGTLHLVLVEDYWLLHPLTTPPLFAGSARRLGQEGVPPGEAERGVAAVERALADGPRTRADLREQVAAADVRVEGQALAHVLGLAALRGLVVRGPVVGREQAYVLTRDWLGAPPPAPDREVALRELAVRYLAGHGPASDRDLARWAGVSLGDARRGLRAAADGLDEGPDGLLDLPGRWDRPVPPVPRPRLLGAFEPLLLGWTSREELVGRHGRLVTDNGVFRPFLHAEGRAVGTWRLLAGRVELQPFEPLEEQLRAALTTDADDVLRFLGLPPPRGPRA